VEEEAPNTAERTEDKTMVMFKRSESEAEKSPAGSIIGQEVL